MAQSTPDRRDRCAPPFYPWLCMLLLAGLLFPLPARSLAAQPAPIVQSAARPGALTAAKPGISSAAESVAPGAVAGLAARTDKATDFVEVIISLREQPLHALAPGVQAAHAPTLDRIRGELRAVYDAPSLPRGEQAAGEGQSASRAEQARALSARLRAALQAMRQDLVARARPQVEASQAGLVAWLESAGARVHTQLVILNAVAAAVPAAQLDALRQRPDVAEVGENRQMAAQLNDSIYAIDADEWHDAGYTGGVWVPGILDSGVRTTHDDIDHFIWPAQPQQVCLTAAGTPADHGAGDVNGHGTHMAGIVLGRDDTLPGLDGMAPGTTSALNLKAAYDTDNSDGGATAMYWSDMMDCTDWALTHTGNVPQADAFLLAYTACATADDSLAARFWDGVVSDMQAPAALPAGNWNGTAGSCTRNVGDAGIAYNAITVGNVDDNNTASSGFPDRDDDTINANSALGPTPGGRRKPDVSAPGTNIYAADNGSDTARNEVTGTSAAAAHVTGALLLLADAGITDPRAQKALLVNTAEDRGSGGWDARYGWGYIDLGAAYSERNNVGAGSISPAPDYDFYLGTWQAGNSATLVWNRQVDYNGEIAPTTVYTLNNLDLYLYNENNNVLLDSDTTLPDNVQVVTSALNVAAAVIKVDAADATFHGAATESYALATSGSFAAAAAPALTIGAPADSVRCPNISWPVTVAITNTGGLAAHSVQVSLDLPTELTVTNGGNPSAAGRIDAGDTAVNQWGLMASAPGIFTVGVDASSGSYGETYTGSGEFTIDVPYEPDAPARSGPADGTTSCDATPTFSWAAVSGASGYRLQIATNINFFAPMIDTTTAQTEYTPSAPVSPGTYYWRVRSTYLCGEGPWTAAAWSLTLIEGPATPMPSAPPHQELSCDDTPTFDWSDVNMATSYNLQVDDAANFSSPVINTDPTVSTYTPSSPLALGTYYWHVNAGNQCGSSAYTTPRELTVITSPSAPTLQAPANASSTCDTTPTFSWSSMAMATGYAVQVDNNSDFSSPEINQTTTLPEYTPGIGLAPGTYWWRARATNKCGESAWSTSRTVTVVVQLAAPALLTPSDGLNTCTRRPVFDWQDVTGATGYRIQGDNNSDFSSPEINQRPTGSTYTPASDLGPATYYWRVQTTNMCGDGVWSSPIRTVTVVVPPAATTLSLPENASEVCDLTPTFDWANVTYATGYRVRVDDDAAYGSPTIDATAAESTYTAPTDLAGGLYYWQARATNMCGDGPWSDSWTMTVLTPLAAPTLQAPLADGVICDAQPSFDWSSVPRAAGYHIQMDSSTSFDSPAIDALTTASEYVSEVTVTEEINYYWRVSSRTSCGEGEWSAARRFTRIMVPEAPSQIAPTDGITLCTSTIPSFSWTSVARATGYRIQVDNDPTFGSPVIETTTTTPQYTAPWALTPARYYWRVLALNQCGNGTWSSYRVLDVISVLNSPALLAPPDGTGACNSSPIFDWADVAGASGYKIQVDDQRNFHSPVVSDTTTTSWWTPSGGLEPNLYYWRVLTFNMCGDGLWSDARNVTVLSTPPAPGSPSPADGSTICDDTPTFDWSDSAEATGYDIQVAEDSSFVSVVISTTTSTSSYTPPTSLQVRPYYWRVRAHGTCGKGRWSATATGAPWSLEIITTPPSPNLATPVDGGSICESSIAFDWDSMGQADSFRLRVDDDPAFMSPAIDVGTSDTSYSPPQALTPDTYYWQVNASNQCGEGPWTTSRQFNVTTTSAAPVPQLPANGSSTCSNTPIFDWPDASGATGYRIQIDDNSDFGSPVIDTNTADSTYTPASPMGGTLYWRVLTVNPCGEGPWSVVWSVTILVPPSGPGLTAPANGSTTCDATPTFDWEDITEALSYWLVADNDPNFGSPELAIAVNSSIYTPLTDLPPNRYYWRVRPLWQCGEGGWSTSWTLVVGASPPTLELPPDEGRTCDATPTFDWSDVPGATSYRIQADNNLNFSSPEVDATATNSSHTVATPLGAWTYNWRVRSMNSCGSSVWSSPLRRVIIVAAPAAPGSLTPVDGTVTCDQTPDLDWSDVTGATAYHIQIDDNSDWTSPEIDTLTGGSAYTPPATLSPGVYHWRVQSTGECGEGAWSAETTLTIVIPPAAPGDPAPPDGSRTCDVTPTFDWADTAGATGYHVQVADSPTFANIEIDTTTTASVMTAMQALPLGPHYWRVAATNMCGEGAWSPGWNLALITAPGEPVLQSPAEAAASCDGLPAFDWTDVEDAISYRIQVDDNPTFSSPELYVTSTVSSLTPGTALADGVYHWRVMAKNNCGEGTWTGPRDLVVGAPPPRLLAPPDGSHTGSATPPFVWGGVLGANTYRLQVDVDPGFGSPAVNVEVTAPGSSFTPSTPLASGWYVWRVRTRTACGYGSWTEPWQLLIMPRIYLPIVMRLR